MGRYSYQLVGFASKGSNIGHDKATYKDTSEEVRTYQRKETKNDWDYASGSQEHPALLIFLVLNNP